MGMHCHCRLSCSPLECDSTVRRILGLALSGTVAFSSSNSIDLVSLIDNEFKLFVAKNRSMKKCVKRDMHRSFREWVLQGMQSIQSGSSTDKRFDKAFLRPPRKPKPTSKQC